MKTCTKCGESKSREEFNKSSHRKDGLQYYCRTCCNARKAEYDRSIGGKERRRVRYNKQKYNLEPTEFTAMLEAQDYRCAICTEELDIAHGKKGYHIDHNHSSGEVRGILCRYCNIALGYLKDSPLNAQAATRYLESRGSYG